MEQTQEAKKESKYIGCMTPTFRVSFPHVFKPHTNFKNQEPAYSIQMLFPKTTDISEMKRIAQQVAKKKWPEGLPENFRSPFSDGDKKAGKLDGYKDMIVVTARSKMKPGLINQKREDIIDAQEFYAGCWARATVTCYAYGGPGITPGVAFGLNNVQKVKDDKAFSGRKNAKDEFGAIEELGGDDFKSTGNDAFEF